MGRGILKCRRCGDPILLLPKNGVRINGLRPVLVPFNVDDKKLHWIRCSANQALHREREKPIARPQKKLPPPNPQSEMF